MKRNVVVVGVAVLLGWGAGGWSKRAVASEPDRTRSPYFFVEGAANGQEAFPLAVVSDSVLAIVADDGIWTFTQNDAVQIYGASAARVPVGGCASEAEGAQGTNGVTWIPTVPTFAAAKASQGEVFGFDYCSVAAALDGTVFIQTYHQLWKVSP